MRIYLDSSALQYLKREQAASLYKEILDDGKKNIYCFSEAHIYDLVRDKTEYKFSDMSFIETIVKDNCWFYDKEIRFEYLTPRAYHDSFEWPTGNNYFGQNMFFEIMRSSLEAIPIEWHQIIKEKELPADIPDNFRRVLEQPRNMYEFTEVFMSFTEELSERQNEFRKFLQYLHKHSVISKLYEKLGIEGFDGEKVTDLELFRTTFQKFCMRDGKPKYRYDLFMEMYNNLEILGIIKGKPKKQGFMNMINDGRHVFFGSFSDIIVSRDEDFIKKAKFMQKVWNNETSVLTLSEFGEYLEQTKANQESLAEMFGELDNFDHLETTYEEIDETKTFVVKNLKRTHLGFFDNYNYVIRDNMLYQYFSKKKNTLSTGTLTKEIEYVVDKLIQELGEDIEKRGAFSSSEIVGGKWPGRNWLIANIGLELNFEDKMFLAFFKFENYETDKTVPGS